MTSTLPLQTIGSVPSLLAATIYQGSHDRKRWICNAISTEIYTVNTGVGGLLIHITSTAGKINIKICVKHISMFFCSEITEPCQRKVHSDVTLHGAQMYAVICRSVIQDGDRKRSRFNLGSLLGN